MPAAMMAEELWQVVAASLGEQLAANGLPPPDGVDRGFFYLGLKTASLFALKYPGLIEQLIDETDAINAAEVAIYSAKENG
jgi:hypothetical protein